MVHMDYQEQCSLPWPIIGSSSISGMDFLSTVELIATKPSRH